MNPRLEYQLREVVMARQVHDRDISKTLAAAQQWINTCLVEDRSVLSDRPLWTAELVDEVYHAFVEHPDYSKADFITKLKRQMQPASPPAQQLLAEMLWALLLFPSNVKARTKQWQVREMWSLSGQQLPDDLPLMRDDVLTGIGSGGPGFNNYRPDEMTFLIALASDLKRRSAATVRSRLTCRSCSRPNSSWSSTCKRPGRSALKCRRVC